MTIDLREVLPGTGAGVRVAVIDSGLNPHHSHVAPVETGVWIRALEPGRIALEPDWIDRMGHGTAVGGAIRAVAPDVTLVAVRIFDEAPAATCDQLVGAIRWAIQAGCQVVNLSLCTPDSAHGTRLRDVCRLAGEHGVLVVAAGMQVPATLPEAIGVVAGGGIAEFELCEAEPPLDFAAHGHPRALPGNRPNFAGHSFAAARVSGFCARLLSGSGGASGSAGPSGVDRSAVLEAARDALRAAVRSAAARAAATR